MCVDLAGRSWPWASPRWCWTCRLSGSRWSWSGRGCCCLSTCSRAFSTAPSSVSGSSSVGSTSWWVHLNSSHPLSCIVHPHVPLFPPRTGWRAEEPAGSLLVAGRPGAVWLGCPPVLWLEWKVTTRKRCSFVIKANVFFFIITCRLVSKVLCMYLYVNIYIYECVYVDFDEV